MTQAQLVHETSISKFLDYSFIFILLSVLAIAGYLGVSLWGLGGVVCAIIAGAVSLYIACKLEGWAERFSDERIRYILYIFSPVLPTGVLYFLGSGSAPYIGLYILQVYLLWLIGTDDDKNRSSAFGYSQCFGLVVCLFGLLSINPPGTVYVEGDDAQYFPETTFMWPWQAADRYVSLPELKKVYNLNSHSPNWETKVRVDLGDKSDGITGKQWAELVHDNICWSQPDAKYGSCNFAGEIFDPSDLMGTRMSIESELLKQFPMLGLKVDVGYTKTEWAKAP
ncbi:hypothetical protein N8083_01160 [Candidatus Pacebacteria bacterium]|nr:hypothetical protein [Candidatus Paceibacterota bacterium]